MFYDGLLNINHIPFKGNIGVCLYPRSVMVLAGGDHVLIARQDFSSGKRQLQAFRKWNELLRVNKKLHLRFGGGNGASVLSQKDAVQWGPRSRC